jgi:hypothetical protein
MAAAKETPRQKMIGMMYLVLTAMLALNVDSAVLERFELINGTLENQIDTNGRSETVLLSKASQLPFLRKKGTETKI